MIEQENELIAFLRDDTFDTRIKVMDMGKD